MESNSSHTDGSESESDRNCSGSDCSDDEDPEVWHEDVDDLFEDVANDEPLPEPIRRIIYTDTDNIISMVYLLFVVLASNLQDK